MFEGINTETNTNEDLINEGIEILDEDNIEESGELGLGDDPESEDDIDFDTDKEESF